MKRFPGDDLPLVRTGPGGDYCSDWPAADTDITPRGTIRRHLVRGVVLLLGLALAAVTAGVLYWISRPM